MKAMMGKYMYLLLIFGLIPAASAVCANGWMRFDDSCYFFEDIQKEPWHIAFNYCRAMDADLVKIESEKENNFIKAELKKFHPGLNEEFWTAGNDIQVENDWVWVGSNERITGFLDWSPGEPNSFGGVEEDCMAISQGYQWNDEQCDRSMSYICEHKDPQGVSEIVG